MYEEHSKYLAYYIYKDIEYNMYQAIIVIVLINLLPT